jgi:hypothetical protein
MTSLSLHLGVCTGPFGAGPGCFKAAAEELHVSLPAPQLDVGPVALDVLYLLFVGYLCVITRKCTSSNGGDSS